MPDSPRIAVVVPCFNDGKYVGDAISSVQESEVVQIVVIDDGSTDTGTVATLAELEKSGTRVVRQANGGLSSARTRGIAETTAPYVFPLDSDDQVMPGALGALADVLDSTPDVSFAYGHVRLFGTQVGQRRAQPWDPFTLLYSNRWVASCLFRRSALVESGGWSLAGCYEDWDALLALAEHGHQGQAVDRDVLLYRRHAVTRMNAGCHERHSEIYRTLRSRHQGLFAQRAVLARRSRTPLWRQALYPLVLGARPLYPWWLYDAIDRRRNPVTPRA